MMSNVSKSRARTFFFVLLVCAWTLPTLAQDAAPEAAKPVAASPLKLTVVDVQPEEPTPETLCKLAVTLRNDGDQPISGLRFAVSVNGHKVPVYDKQVFLEVVAPGGETTVPLYNFWVTETGRPLPDKGPLSVEVQVTEARWTKVEREPVEPDGAEPKSTETIETWTLLEALKALPAAVTVTRNLRRP